MIANEIIIKYIGGATALFEVGDKVCTTLAGAERLGGNAIGIKNGVTIEVPTRDNHILPNNLFMKK